MKFHLIAAVDNNRGIGIAGALPWCIKKDILFFKDMTTSQDPDITECRFGMRSGESHLKSGDEQTNKPGSMKLISAVIMGRITWESIPERFRPLKDRYNYIISRSRESRTGETVGITGSFEAALEDAEKKGFRNVFVIGGESLYSAAVVHKDCGRIYLTQIDRDFNCDKFFPALPADFTLTGFSKTLQEQNISFRFEVYERS